MIRIINHVTTRKYSTANLRKEAQFLTLSDFLDCADSVLDTDWTVNVRRTLNRKGNLIIYIPCTIILFGESCFFVFGVEFLEVGKVIEWEICGRYVLVNVPSTVRMYLPSRLHTMADLKLDEAEERERVN